MSEWLEDNWIWLMIVALLGLTIWAAVAMSEEHVAWVKECVADGVPNYRCEERWDTAHPPAPQTTVHVHQ